MPGRSVAQAHRGSRHRYQVFQKPAAIRIRPIARGRQSHQGRCVLLKQPQHQPAQRFVANVIGCERAQFLEQLGQIVPRAFQEVRLVEAVLAVGVGHGADVVDLDLRPVALVLLIDRPELVELSRLPVALAGGEPLVVAPDHQRRCPPGVAEPAVIVRLALARDAARPVGQQGEKVAALTGGQFAQGRQRRLRGGHSFSIIRRSAKASEFRAFPTSLTPSGKAL